MYRTVLACAALAFGAPPARAAEPPRLAFPAAPLVLKAKRDLGAKGDGVDDTEALQKGLDLSSGFNQKTTKVLFLPNGTYRVTKSLVVNNALGPWLYGESRDGVVIKLAGDNKDDTAVLQKAVDAAAKAGKTVVYLRGCGGYDPNWHTVDGEVKVHGSVRWVIGLGWARVLGGK